MALKIPKWESELWSYLSAGDGINCPVYQSCPLNKSSDFGCYNENEGFFKQVLEFLDKDELGDTPPAAKNNNTFCPSNGRIFNLIGKLAGRLHEQAGIETPPVSNNLIRSTEGGIPIEVRPVPLRAYRGAVWRLSNSWVVQINRNDSTARQRYTLYHEIFHILAHSKATPVFKKAGRNREGTFNEMLADHFSGACLMPEKLVRKFWPETRDIKVMARIFDVPEPIAWLELKHLLLI
jgi:hypothetical protein